MKAPPKGFMTPQYTKTMVDRGYLYFSAESRIYTMEPLPLTAEMEQATVSLEEARRVAATAGLGDPMPPPPRRTAAGDTVSAEQSIQIALQEQETAEAASRADAVAMELGNLSLSRRSQAPPHNRHGCRYDKQSGGWTHVRDSCRRRDHREG